jgi:hypothetical protein
MRSALAALVCLLAASPSLATSSMANSAMRCSGMRPAGGAMQAAAEGGDSTPTPDFSLYDIASGPSQLAGTATYNGTELTTVLECFGEGFTEGVGLVCTTGGTWTEQSDGASEGGWPGAWSDHTNETINFEGTADQRIEGPSADVIDVISGKEVFLEVVFRPSITNETGGLIDFRDESGTGHGARLYMQSGNVRADIITSAGASGYQSAAATALSWNHAVGVMNSDASTGSVVVAGVNGAASVGGGTAVDGAISGTTGLPAIGDLANGVGTYQFNGSIAYIAIRTCSGCVVDESGNTTTDEWIAERFARLTGTYAADGADKIPNLATRASAGYTCHLNDSGVRKCDQVGDNWIRTYDVADTGWDDASATHTTGVLIEEERTNLAIRSGELNQATHAKNALTISTDTSGGPLGTYDEMIADATTNAHYLRQTTTVASGVTHSVSRILKAGDQDWALINVTTSCGAGGVATSGYFDLSTCDKGTITNASDSFAEEWGDGFCRVGLSWVTSSTSCLIDTASAEADGDFTFLGDGSTATTLWAHGQFEAGAYPSSPIVTSGSSVTRSADAFENGQDITGPASMCVKLVTPATDSGSAQYALDVHSGASDFAALLAEDGGDAATFLVSATSTQADITGTDQTDGSAVVLRGYFSDDDFELFEDGSSVGTDTSGTSPSSLTDITIGAKQNGTGQLNGVILAVGVYDGTELETDGVCE